jgi:ATP-dependent RNA helicase RhlE
LTTFEQFNLQNQSKAIDDLGFTTYYSGKNFSVIMSGRDMMGLHKQGTGKTFAYLLPFKII